MSASLVGSEMCIRDRLSREPLLLGGRPPPPPTRALLGSGASSLQAFQPGHRGSESLWRVGQ
eukprot:6662168-Alexandrium_andersonii.AAC.1